MLDNQKDLIDARGQTRMAKLFQGIGKTTVTQRTNCNNHGLSEHLRMQHTKVLRANFQQQKTKPVATPFHQEQ